MEIVREAAEGVSTAALSERFGVSQRAIQYTLKADAERQKDSAVATTAVTVKLTPDELEALDALFSAAGIETAQMERFRVSLHEVGNGVVQLSKRMAEASRAGQGTVVFSDLQLAQIRGLARFILDSADEIDLLVRRRRDAMQLVATAALREFAHAAE